MRCLAKDRNNNECRNHATGDTRFCTYHDYMVDYTEEMMNKCVCCSGCNKMMYISKNGKTCDKCRERAKSNRNECRENVVMCKSNGCKSKKSSENAYCLKHQICLLVEEVAIRNKRLCVNYIRGCRSELELDHIKNRCEICLEKDRKKDKQRRNKATEMNASFAERPEDAAQNSDSLPRIPLGNPSTDEPVSELISQTPLVEKLHLELGCDETYNDEKSEVTEKTCTVCCKTATVEMFQGVKGVITKTCKTCRDMNKKNDMKRDKEHRNTLARIASKNPERIAVKQAWKEENYEKVAETWQKSRNKRIETLGVEEYLKRNTMDAKRWRDNNPEKVAENNELRKQNVNIHYRNYQRSAMLKNLQFDLCLDAFITMVHTPCYYCGLIEDKGFNGIDRMIQTEGYVTDNCTSCCQMCNYMKCSLSTDIFLRRIDHILMYNTYIADGELNPCVFMDHKCVSYDNYQTRAKNKPVEFTITREQFHELIQHNCYICGKQPTNTHINGIDRYNNIIGYIYENCRTCCGECNYMKKHFEYDKMFEKFMQIYKNRIVLWKTEPSIKTFVSEQSNSIMVTTNKKSKVEITEMKHSRKRIQQQELKEKSCDESYSKRRAREISDNRRKLLIDK